jgi:hypothetical protein
MTPDKMSDSIQILSQFKTQLLTFFDELIGQFPQEGDIVVARLFIANQMPMEDAVNKFLWMLNYNDSECRNMIQARNEKFFLEHEVFPLGESRWDPSFFKRLWISPDVDKRDKEIIWKWMDTFIFLGDKFAKSKTSN